MEFDPRLMLTVAGILVSVVSAAVIVKTKLSTVIDSLTDIEARLRVIDSRVDKTELTAKSVEILSSMLSPAEREKSARETATMLEKMNAVQRELDTLRHMHNGVHPK